MIDNGQRHSVTRRQWLAGIVGAGAFVGLPAAALGQDARQTLRLRVQGSTVIALPETAGTGFGWRLNMGASRNLAAVSVADEGMVRPPGAPMIGATGERQFRITAQQPGTATVVFDYLRPWEHVAPARRRIFTVDISGR